jgi:predicted dienelactone hydrolase
MPPREQDAVRDAAATAGRWPLVAFSHGFGGHRRQSTFFCTHLASHGYVVVAVDHAGNTMTDVIRRALAVRAGREKPDTGGVLGESMAHRPADLAFAIDRVLDGSAGHLTAHVDADRLATSGHSFGGWTALLTTSRDDRIRACVALAPAGGRLPDVATPLADALELGRAQTIPTLLMVGEEDCILPMSSMHDLVSRIGDGSRMIVIEHADHMHFCDRAREIHELFRTMPPPGPLEGVAKHSRPFDELCPAEHAYDVVRGLGLAHLDAALKRHAAARAFVDGDVAGHIAVRGIRARVGG